MTTELGIFQDCASCCPLYMAYLPFFVPQGADGNWAGEEALILVTSGVDGRVWRAHHPLTTQNTPPPRALSACAIGISEGWV